MSAVVADCTGPQCAIMLSRPVWIGGLRGGAAFPVLRWVGHCGCCFSRTVVFATVVHQLPNSTVLMQSCFKTERLRWKLFVARWQTNSCSVGKNSGLDHFLLLFIMVF